MKPLLSLWMIAIAGIVTPAAVAGQQAVSMEDWQKARPDPVALTDVAAAPENNLSLKII
ncbi:MAG: hypothetical protein HY938_06075 [Nitrosomonadales bacterium]|nr:hypothetical protein [Nitrosomonadales bacterium]